MTSVSEIFWHESDRIDIFSRTAFVAIDVQRVFCDPYHDAKRGTRRTHDIAHKIHSFRKKINPLKQVLVVAAGFDDHVNFDLCGLDQNDWDVILQKEHNSLFVNCEILQQPLGRLPYHPPSDFGVAKAEYVLRWHNINHLIVSGFNTSACVAETVLDAIDHDFSVTVLSDLVGQGYDKLSELGQEPDLLHHAGIEKMRQSRAKIITSQEFLDMAHGLTTHINAFSPHP